MSTRNAVNCRVRLADARPAIEALESRRLLSVSLAESEPNNSRARADELPRVLEKTLEVRGKIATTADHDWFKLQLKAGDVIGVAVTGGKVEPGGLDPYARLLDASGNLVIENAGPSFQIGDSLPAESPLPRADRDSFSVEFYRVMPEAGTYYLDVSASAGESTGQQTGRYDMEVVVARPGLEAAPRGTKQILFLDFDGARVDYRTFVTSQPPIGRAKLSPMRDSLKGFNLSRRDESDVIDAVVRRMKDLLSDDIERHGLNGDYDRSGRAGEFDLEIRNSRDHRDSWGKDPLVSRIVIGGTNEEAGFVGEDWEFTVGLASTIDVGNFKTDDQAVATLQWITDAVDVVSAAPGISQVELFAEGIANIAAHEAGHIFGADHTDDDPADADEGVGQVMNPFVGEFIGPDVVLGTEDDLPLEFGVDEYLATEWYRGINDTLNTLAFGLSTGTGRGRPGGDDEDDDDRGGRGTGRRQDRTGWKNVLTSALPATPTAQHHASAAWPGAAATPTATTFLSKPIASTDSMSAWSRLAPADAEDHLAALT